MACRAAGLEPGRDLDLAALRGVGSTGAPLPAAGFRWVAEHVSNAIPLGSLSGGTDLCTGFLGPSPLVPVWAGEISCRMLGARVEAFDPEGRPRIGEQGELVITAPMPSMPVGLWGDADGSRMRAAYFEPWPGRLAPRRLAHGHRPRLVPDHRPQRRDAQPRRRPPRDRGVLRGRRGAAGRRGQPRRAPRGPGRRPGRAAPVRRPAARARPLDDDLRRSIKRALRDGLSPRHVPDAIHAVPAIPRTLSGKKLEVPVKRILLGLPADEAAAKDALADPRSLEPFEALAAARAAAPRADAG